MKEILASQVLRALLGATFIMATAGACSDDPTAPAKHLPGDVETATASADRGPVTRTHATTDIHAASSVPSGAANDAGLSMMPADAGSVSPEPATDRSCRPANHAFRVASGLCRCFDGYDWVSPRSGDYRCKLSATVCTPLSR